MSALAFLALFWTEMSGPRNLQTQLLTKASGIQATSCGVWGQLSAPSPVLSAHRHPWSMWWLSRLSLGMSTLARKQIPCSVDRKERAFLSTCCGPGQCHKHPISSLVQTSHCLAEGGVFFPVF